ncbi:eukaryotic aspartyl protease domain-containing protein [Ditylenchus destructor]|uniref:Eukaryotic aspartyl protease domain-containing protein n=1 Tax=Ditylenchus destructor TaxID=166010 RepID=A0AAD4MNL3_9BILA|nr:eukaryotic aspartyl protease domain-containing protein [Ditylenchus destructor]
MLRQIICLAIIFFLAEASVHKFLAKPYRLEGEAAAIRHNAIRNRRLESVPENLRNFESLSKLSPKLALNRTMDSEWIYTANVTIGTPAQTYLMEIDMWYAQDLCIIGSSANLSRVDPDLPPKHTYDPSSSSTYVDKNGNFTDYPCGKGINGSDQIKVDDVSANVVMGVITDKIGYYLRYYPVDGVLGLNPTAPYTNADNLVSQLVGTMDNPIMSWWQNMSRYNEGIAQLTLGGEDTDNCQSNYVYAPQQHRNGTYGDYGVHIASAQIDGVSDNEVSLNTTTSLWPDQGRIYCSYDFFYVLTNASNAVFNETSDEWEVDCDLSKTKNIILNIGGSGDKADGTTKQLILTGADYIYHWQYDNTCVVYAYPSEYAQVLELSSRFVNNHCVAYNAKEKTVGFADVKVKNNDPKTY